ncbi:5-formyltetrahydrofolate cyclo-ligase [Aphelenchoides avenae]|nr:5-formyltetrahydrofolate cyclo-ligase [Aphelenchus avenae]
MNVVPETPEVVMAKKALRKEIGQLVAKVAEDVVKRESDAVNKTVLNADWYKNACRVSIFVSTAGEIVTDDLIKHALKENKEVFLPRFKKGAKEMEMLRLKNEEEFANLDTSLWGIRQFHVDRTDLPAYEESGPLDLVLCPSVCLTRQGARLGHGKGFYDRFFAKHKELFGRYPKKVAIALTAQMVEEVPMAEHDVRMDHIVTANEHIALEE